MSVMQSMQLMMSIKAAIAGITYVGSSQAYGPPVSGSKTVTFTVSIPSACAVGDVLLLTYLVNNKGGYLTSTFPARSVLALAAGAANDPFSSNAAQILTLNSSDITAGTLTTSFTTSSTVSGPYASVIATAFRMVDGTGLDVAVSAQNNATEYTSPQHIPASGVTTVSANDMLVYWASVSAPDTSQFTGMAAPIGWNKSVDYTASSSEFQSISYNKQGGAGATGDVIGALSFTGDGGSIYSNGWLFALKPRAPVAFALSGTFPDATVGAAWTGVLTFTGDYTGPVVMDVAAGTKPAWIGTPVVDEGAKTATYTGTPTAATSISFTPRATPAVGTAATAPQTFAVAAASSGLVPVMQNSVAYAAIPSSFTLPLNPSSPATPAHFGALLTAAWGGYSSRTPIPSAGWTNGGTATSGDTRITLFTKISDGTETGITFSQTSSGAVGCSGAIIEWPVGATLGSINNQGSGTTFSNTVSSTPAAPAYNATYTGPPPLSTSIPCICYCMRTSPGSITASPPWTNVFKGSAGVDGSIGYCYEPAPNMPDSVVLTRDTTSPESRVAYLTLWINP